jgi:hypothetical protein
MALTIKNLGKGALSSGNSDIVAQVGVGKAALVENVIFVNKGVSSETTVVEIVRASPSKTIRILSQSIAANDRFVLETVTLTAGDKLRGFTTSAVDFLASGVEKDL